MSNKDINKYDDIIKYIGVDKLTNDKVIELLKKKDIAIKEQKKVLKKKDTLIMELKQLIKNTIDIKEN